MHENKRDENEENMAQTGSDDIRGKSRQIPYERPIVKTYTSEEILEAIGPAQACSPAPCPVGN